MHRLRVSRHGQRVRELVLHGECSVGRHPENLLYLAEGSVSSYHAKIEVRHGGCVLQDLGSSNGTLVDGQRLDAHDRVMLEGGEKIGIGPFKLEYVAPQVAHHAEDFASTAWSDREESILAEPTTPGQQSAPDWLNVTALLAVIAALAVVVFAEIL